MQVSVHYYAAAKELSGCGSSTFEFDAPSISQSTLRQSVAERFPSLGPFLQRMRLAVNGDFVDGATVLRDGDRIDVLPPVAGGSQIPICALTNRPISVERIHEAVEHPGAGGVCVFYGVVRNHAEGKAVSRLEYEAHESLAEKEMRRVLEGVAAEHPAVLIAAEHRIGSLTIGDVAVCIAASAPHRDEAFTACRKAIDRIKETVPIWKKEWDADGEAHWVNLEG